MVAFANAQVDTVVQIARHHLPAAPMTIVLDMEPQMMLMQPMGVIALARTTIEDQIAPFHQLAAVSTTAMDMLLWTWIPQMVVSATVLMAGPA